MCFPWAKHHKSSCVTVVLVLSNFLLSLSQSYAVLCTHAYAAQCPKCQHSGYSINHPNYDASNKKVIGKFKDELKGEIITEFIGLKPKMYSYIVDDNEFKKAKGVPKKTLKRALNFENYRRTLQENECKKIKFNSIRSYQHQVYII